MKKKAEGNLKINTLNDHDYTINQAEDNHTTITMLTPTPRINLNDLEGVRREMARVYKDMRFGVIQAPDGARLVYVLGELRKMFEICEIQKRIDMIEQVTKIRKVNN